jgi:hypothetical protein
MTYAVVHKFAGATQEQRDATVAAVDAASGGLPEGQLYRVDGPSADGWVVVAVHETKEAWERFRDGTLMPLMQKGIEGGFSAPPEEVAAFEAYGEDRT